MQNHKTSRRKNLGGLGFDNEFLDIAPQVYSWKKKIGQLDFIKNKIFCSVTPLENKKTSQKLGENLYKTQIWWRTCIQNTKNT